MMPQPADYLAAYALLTALGIMGCGYVVLLLVALFDRIRIQHKRAVLRRRRS